MAWAAIFATESLTIAAVKTGVIDATEEASAYAARLRALSWPWCLAKWAPRDPARRLRLTEFFCDPAGPAPCRAFRVSAP